MDKHLSDKDFVRLSSFITNTAGINMPLEKKLLLQNRLHKRVELLKMTSFNEYVNFVFSIHGSEELTHLIDLSTTNTTNFFRENAHFIRLCREIIPNLCENSQKKELKIWCAGCSSGEEAYSLAICFHETLKQYSDISYRILATDISTRVLDLAIQGIYGEHLIRGVSAELKNHYFMKSSDPTNSLVRVVPEIRSRITFQQLNLMNSTYDIENEYDVVFCRNVMIYFSRENQMNILHKIMRHLRNKGYFFNGHSEALINMNLPLEKVSASVWRRN